MFSSCNGQNHLAKSSIQTHASGVASICTLMCNQPGRQECSIDDLLRISHSAVVRTVENNYREESSAAAVMNSLLSILRCRPFLRKEYGQTFHTWRKAGNKHKRVEVQRYIKGKLTKNQSANWVTMEELESKLQTLKDKSPHSASEDKARLHMHVHTAIKPKRLDLHAIKNYRNSAPPNADEQRENYLVLGKQLLELNHYSKTGIIAGCPVIREHVPAGLVQHIKESLPRYPRAYLFTDKEGAPYSPNAFARFIVRVHK